MADPGPMSDTLERLVRMASDVLGTPVEVDSGLIESGFSSSALLALLGRIATEFDVELPVAALFRRGDLVGLGREVDRRLALPTPGADDREGPVRDRDVSVAAAGPGAGRADRRRALRDRIRASVVDR